MPRYRPCQAILNKHGVSFTWCDIEHDKEGRSFVEQVNDGQLRVPTIVFSDGSILVEPGNSELEEKIGVTNQ